MLTPPVTMMMIVLALATYSTYWTSITTLVVAVLFYYMRGKWCVAENVG